MAEIHVEKKKPVWPWIILVLVILAVLYFLFFADGQNDDDLNDMDGTEQVEDTTVWENETQDTADWDTTNDTLDYTAGEGVSGYVEHIGDESRMGIDHEYTNNALLQLINAVEEKARELNVDIETEMQQIRQDAQNITRNPQATDHAGNIKNAGSGITNVLQSIQQEQFPDLDQDVEQLRSSVEDIDPSVETLQQKDRINSFFHEAADVLQKMN